MVNMSTTSNHSTPRSSNHHASFSQHHHAPSTTATLPVARSTIDDFREIIREQSFIIPSHSSSSDPNHLDVPVRKYPPLPDISTLHVHSNTNAFYRTETILTQPKTELPRKQMCFHFASGQYGHLPSLSKRPAPLAVTNAMDLDEDLPQCGNSIPQRTATYTSPGDRVISPIKRPSAPSPPASAQIKRAGQNAFVYGEEEQDEEDEDDEENCSALDDDESQLFDEHFYHYTRQPINMFNRRIDHYNPHSRYFQINQRQDTLILDGDHDDGAHPLDSLDLEP